MSIEFVQHSEVNSQILADIYSLKEENWPNGIGAQENWIKENINKCDVHLLLYDKYKTIIGYSNLVRRLAVIDKSAPVEVLGIGNVCISDAFKDTGRGKEMLIAINEYLIARDTCGILFCKDNLVKFYHKYNWKLINPKLTEFEFNTSKINTMVFNIEDHISIKMYGNSF